MELNSLNKMILEEIKVGKDEESKRDVILENLGEQVILYDFHEHWAHGFLLRKGYDHQVYQMHIADSRGKRQFWYKDLQQLFLLKAHRNFPLPEIDPFPV